MRRAAVAAVKLARVSGPAQAALPLRLRPGVAPSALSGALGSLETVGTLLAEAVRTGEWPAPGDAAWCLDQLRSIYRVVHSVDGAMSKKRAEQRRGVFRARRAA